MLEPLFLAAGPAMERMLCQAEPYADRLAELRGPAPEPRLDQDWFARLDAALLYGFIREQRPGRIVEIGSGHSTRFAVRAVRDAGSHAKITAIDPAPRASLAGLPVQLMRCLLQDASPALLAMLQAGDLLVIDSSHVAVPGSDVDLLLNDVLPRLAAGVVVHVHDIFLPDPYPESWAWRGYNEQVAVGALLQGGAYEILFSSHFMTTRRADRLAASPLSRLPLVEGARETSLWLQKRG
jgi:predicted O-methyltransferase YrrM